MKLVHVELKILKVVDVHKLFTLKLIYQHQTCKLPITFKEYFKVGNEIQNRATRNDRKLNIPKAKTNYGYNHDNSIKVVGAKIINCQRSHKSTNGKKLQKLVKIYLLSKYWYFFHHNLKYVHIFLFNKWYGRDNLCHHYTNQLCCDDVFFFVFIIL